MTLFFLSCGESNYSIPWANALITKLTVYKKVNDLITVPASLLRSQQNGCYELARSLYGAQRLHLRKCECIYLRLSWCFEVCVAY